MQSHNIFISIFSAILVLKRSKIILVEQSQFSDSMEWIILNASKKTISKILFLLWFEIKFFRIK